MSEKTFKIVNGDMSDGYHTFDELYDHRCLLFINWMISDGAPGIAKVVENHFEGWDLIFCQTSEGQISYHVPRKMKELYSTLNKVPSNPEYDGHTSADVVARLANLANKD